MKTTLYYFSGTGNSLSLANAVQAHLPDCEMVPIVAFMQQKAFTVRAQCVGVVFPLHFMGLPALVDAFFKQVDFQDLNYIFTVVTGDKPQFGNALQTVNKHLRRGQHRLDAGYLVPMPAAHFPYVRLSKAVDPQELYRQSQEKVLQICDNTRLQKQVFDKEYAVVGDIHAVFSPKERPQGVFTVAEGCVLCGYCTHVCPANNIRLYGRQVEWSDHCLYCFACVHYCSQSVIQYKHLSQGKARIHHPSITLDAISQQRG